jgi:hypothetical protein
MVMSQIVHFRILQQCLYLAFTRGVEQARQSFNKQVATKQSQAYSDEKQVKTKGQVSVKQFH